MPARKTLVGAIALLGEGAVPSEGAVDVVIDGRLIARYPAERRRRRPRAR